MRADRVELDIAEAQNFFQGYGVQLKLTMAYNPEANGKSEKGHPPIIHALVKACKDKANIWPKLFPFALWADRPLIIQLLITCLLSLCMGTSP